MSGGLPQIIVEGVRLPPATPLAASEVTSPTTDNDAVTAPAPPVAAAAGTANPASATGPRRSGARFVGHPYF